MSQIRQNFYNGQNVGPENLNNIQSYVEDRNAEMISGLMGYGIVEGFNVVKENQELVSVSGGLAYTEHGVRLFSISGANISIEKSLFPQSGSIMLPLALRFEWDKKGSALDSTQTEVTTEWTQSISLAIGSDIGKDDLKIADIKIEADGINSIVENGQRFLNFEQQVAKTKAFSTEGNKARVETEYLNLITQNLQINGEDLRFYLFKDRFAIGDYYEQDWDIENKDWKPTPLERFGFGTWRQVVTNGEFKRYQGGNAGENRIDGRQDYAMKHITGSIANGGGDDFGIFITHDVNGVFSPLNNGRHYPQSSGSGNDRSTDALFDNARQGNVSDSEERPINYPVILWVLESYE